jgi:hypothetical protein
MVFIAKCRADMPELLVLAETVAALGVGWLADDIDDCYVLGDYERMHKLEELGLLVDALLLEER